MTRGWQITLGDDGPRAALVDDLDDDALRVAETVGDVEVDVTWSGLNFKDALAFAGDRGVVRRTPLIPGIDVVGRVTASRHARWAVGHRVLLNGGGAGETRHGGLAERAILDGSTLVAVPEAFSDRQAAAIGTAGFTAMLAVLALEEHAVEPDAVLVTGASGGLGSFAIALLARRGMRVIAATGRPENADHLRALGAAEIIDRAELDRDCRPLESQRFSGAIDSVGGRTLATALASVRQGGTVAACGMAGGTELPTTVMPFILRAVTLTGVNSALCALPRREQAWARLAADLDPAVIDRIAAAIPLEDARARAADLLAGRVLGRLAVSISQEQS